MPNDSKIQGCLRFQLLSWGNEHSILKMLFFKSKIYLWNPHWQLWKGKGSLHGQPTMSARSIYSWSRRDSFLTKELHGSTNYHRTKCDSAKLIRWHKSYKSEAKSNIGQLLLYDNYFFRFPILKLHLHNMCVYLEPFYYYYAIRILSNVTSCRKQ